MYLNKQCLLTIAKNFNIDISSSFLSSAIVLWPLVWLLGSVFALEFFLHFLKAPRGDSERIVCFPCLVFQKSATSKSFSLDCNKNYTLIVKVCCAKKYYFVKYLQNRVKANLICLLCITYILT